MKTIDVIVEGGKASAGPPLAPALAPMGINIGQVVAKINEETAAFGGMKVPVKVIVDPATKQFTIEVGSPPTSEIIKKEVGIEKGAGNREAPAGNLTLEKAVQIAKTKRNSLGKDLSETLKEILGTCLSMGVTIEGKNAREVIKEVNQGKHDSLLKG
ncbi:50S ribosomal protein L11 [Candidatus Micrarchaeota archaeon]|nr:50S ribosomal protein L11 [Candidatus Micrarchaeota archaeon]MBU1166734.1 50S ribosomal protein L11 [Candidatus Micrarchaeota archaeon]MBU1886697.1 50S ribosomal protein L11 [Candidatus Micrarchaeota archaeon]